MASTLPPTILAPTTPRRAFLFGESGIENTLSFASNGTINGYFDKGFVTWFQRLSGYPLLFSASNFYCGLYTSTMLLAALQGQVLAKLPDFDIIFMSVTDNDVGNGILPATSLANVKAMVNPLLNAGKWVVLTTSYPNNQFNSNQTKQALYLNQMLREWVRTLPSNIPFFLLDPWRDIADPALSNGHWLAGLSDGVDPYPAGGYLIGKRLYNLIGGLIPPAPNFASSQADVYDATYNPTGNLLINGSMATLTGGGKDGQIGGTWPANWYGAYLQGTGITALTVVGSGAANPAGFAAPPGGMQTIAVNILSGNTNNEAFRLIGNTSGWSVGDTIYAQVEMSLSSIANMINCALDLQDNTNNIVVTDGLGGDIGKGIYPGTYPTLTFRAPPMTIAAGCAQVQLNALWYFDASSATGGAATATIGITGAFVRKLLP